MSTSDRTPTPPTTPPSTLHHWTANDDAEYGVWPRVVHCLRCGGPGFAASPGAAVKPFHGPCSPAPFVLEAIERTAQRARERRSRRRTRATR